MFWLIEKFMRWLVDRERRALENLKKGGGDDDQTRN
jgi:hypothetical protein